MPTLEFEGKSFVYSHHLSVPYRELIPVKDKGVGEPELSGNLIIHGDNLEALKALLPRYAGKVDVIYIDPPYNTGKEGWAYNDKVSSPMMKKWLGRVVDKEDMQRHDKWLCMMWPRTELLRELLSDSGVIFVSIDDNETARCRALFDDIFREGNFVGTLVWKSATDNNPTRIAVEHEYVHCYAKNIESVPRHWINRDGETRDLMLGTFDRLKAESKNFKELSAAWSRFLKEARKGLGDLYRYRLIDEEGPYVARRNLENPGKPGYDYEVEHPVTHKPCAKPYWGWRYSEDNARPSCERSHHFRKG
ncbi:MAG: site-specific DNA-methyltransferase [Mesorhizobium sp.]|uniref:site-specific DNA-methyltransferase n=1 Tax=Mesorhizobium sp. TaxID=1871066 RepID=UPI0012189DE8|nr:site-specific DNA-methyltransferase [Mesorhizobium sp.]TIL88504.1 MAG: site-specific DNA-methyltransferase [Mesorhizobium sp.]TIL99783.1 MAG: site-specific DNA-methyltransferase [Mesorhizobium sp.]